VTVPQCIKIPESPIPKGLTLPGGGVLSQLLAAGHDSLDAVMNLLAQGNSAMAPLIPIFNIIDAVIALFNCVQALPDALGPPPDPSKLSKCIPGLVEKIDQLLALLPQRSLPLLIIGIIDCLVDYLIGVRQQLLGLIEHLAQVASAATRAEELGDVNLLDLVKCAEDKVEIQLDAINDSVTPINKTIALLNVFLEMLGLPKVPDLGVIITDNPEDALAPIDGTIDLLKSIRDSVPMP
jgi:hypothetical protein